MPNNTHAIVTWPDEDVPEGHDFVMIERCGGGIVCVLRASVAGEADTLADAWAACRALEERHPRNRRRTA